MVNRALVCLMITGALIVGYALPASAQSLMVRIVSITNPVMRDADASLTVRTDPGAECRAIASVLSDRKAGASDKSAAASGADPAIGKSKGRSLILAAQVADARGTVTWKVRVDPHSPRGMALVTVECALGGRKGSAETKVEIR